MPSSPLTTGRFAPSPTGRLHIGSLATAVGSWLMARHDGGRWLLRMDDLDTARVVPGMADDIQQTLERFCLYWDGELSWQSRHLDAYHQAFEQLRAAGLIYPCYCSRKEIQQSASAPAEGEETVRYPETCRAREQSAFPVRSWRLRTSDTSICFTDRCAGTVCQNIRRLYGDFALQRGDGGFTYQLAVVVDDQITGVNQVVRGRDLLDSTGRQIYLQQQLGVLHPLYAHLPLVTGRDGGKLSKRDNLVSEQLHNWHGRESLLLADILRFLGMNVPDELKLLRCDEILQWGVLHFDAAHIPDKNSTLEYVQG